MQAEAAEVVRRARRTLAALSGVDLDPDTLFGTEESPDTHLAILERHAAVEAVLADLSPRDRLLLRLR